jgi:hypothetical protein
MNRIMDSVAAASTAAAAAAGGGATTSTIILRTYPILKMFLFLSFRDFEA